MDKKKITIELDEHALDELGGYAFGSNVKTEELIEGLVYDFLRFQNSEMEELYLTDEGEKWLYPSTLPLDF